MIALVIIIFGVIIFFVIRYIIRQNKQESNKEDVNIQYSFDDKKVENVNLNNNNNKESNSKSELKDNDIVNIDKLVDDKTKLELDKYIYYLLPKINYWYLGNFSFPQDVVKKLDNNPTEDYINSLIKIVLESTNTDIKNLKVICEEIKESQDYVGLYKKEIFNESITIGKSSTSLAERYIVIILHECAHKILENLNIRYENTLDNEKLTDISTLVLGLVDYNAEGYLYGVGYLKYPELMYCKIKINYIFEERNKFLKQNIQNKLYELSAFLNYVKQKINSLQLFQKPKELSFSDYAFFKNIQNGIVDNYISNILLKIDNIVENNVLEVHNKKIEQYLINVKNIHTYLDKINL